MQMRWVAVLMIALPLLGQDPQAKEPAAKKAAPAPTNIKVLKVTTDAEVRQIMRTFTVGLGVQCAYCHVAGNNASDDNPKKEVARQMIAITQDLNRKFPDNTKLRVTCYTCHRGEAEPKTAPEPKGL
jgi:Photosynthetic reaction centre cytochrome C subunit